MAKQLKITVSIIVGIVFVIILVGMYKFNYLANKDNYSVDGNKMIAKSHLISPAEFKEKVDSGEYVLVDIRTSEEFKQEKIPGAELNLDFYADDFEEQVNKLDKNKKYLYYCRSGHRSGEASALAKKFNFTEAYELDGGINAWKDAGYKTIK